MSDDERACLSHPPKIGLNASVKTPAALSLLLLASFALGSSAEASWWCATNFHDHQDQVCQRTKTECEELQTPIQPYLGCFEQANVTLLEFTQVNRGRVFRAFPLVSQCDRARKRLLKSPADYNAIGTCHSSSVSGQAFGTDAAVPKPDTEAGRVDDDIPRFLSVSEVSKDGHAIHNRLTFDCQAADPSRWPPKEMDCVVIQQNLQAPLPPPSKEEWDKQSAEIAEAEVMKVCEEIRQPPKKEPTQGGGRTKEELRAEAEFREKLAKPCEKKDGPAVRAILWDLLRAQAERESQTCTLMTIPRRYTFAHVKKGVWVSVPDLFKLCKNVKVTGTLRREPGDLTEWNYTEETIATPSKDSFCHAETGTIEFTWRKAVTPSELKCRYLTM